jgi:hypothetical protein
MSRGSLRILVACIAVTPLAAAEEPVCANCWDGPEMFEHGLNPSFSPVFEIISTDEIATFPICSLGQALEMLGGRKWLVTDCDGNLQISPAPDNPISSQIILLKEGDGYRLADEPPEDERATAAYLELRALTVKQIEGLVREVHKARKRY